MLIAFKMARLEQHEMKGFAIALPGMTYFIPKTDIAIKRIQHVEKHPSAQDWVCGEPRTCTQRKPTLKS